MFFSGYNIYKAIKELNSLKSLSKSNYDTYLEKLKWLQFNYFLNNNSFYKKFIQEKKIVIWEDIPILSKKHIQLPLTEILSNSFTLNQVFKNKTSGSSGNPFYFAKDKSAHSKTWALIFDRYSRHGIEYGVSLQARFYGIPLNGLSYFKEITKDYFSKRIRFPIFNLNDDILKTFLQKFKKYEFHYINGYTSSLVTFADYLISNNIVLKNICPTLKICFPTSEMCSSIDRATIEKGFGVKVANEYGCAEMDILAFEDENFDWIISDENVFFEIVDDNGKVLEPGNSGRILITSLYNKAIPLIRYELGDIGVLKKSKNGYNNILEALNGRTNEFAILPSGRIVPALTFYYITKTLIQDDFKIEEFIVKQLSNKVFHFEYVSELELSQNAIVKIRNAMDEYLEPGLESTFEKKSKIERSASGKLKQFYNLTNVQDVVSCPS